MSDTQGNYDLALSRADHDMWFPVSPTNDPTTEPRYQIWPINGADKVAQQIKITLLAFLGEWFLDITFGVPYLEEILVKNPHLASVETILRAHINNVPRVIRLESFNMTFDRARRTLGVEFEAVTDYGPVKDSVKLDTAHV